MNGGDIAGDTLVDTSVLKPSATVPSFWGALRCNERAETRAHLARQQSFAAAQTPF